MQVDTEKAVVQFGPMEDKCTHAWNRQHRKPLCEATHTYTPMHRWQYPSAQARLDLDRHLRPRQRPNTPVVRSGISCEVPLEQRGQPEVGVLSAESLAEQWFPMWPLKYTKSCAHHNHALGGIHKEAVRAV